MTNREKRAVTDKLAEMAAYYNLRFSENGKKTGGRPYRRLEGAMTLAHSLGLPHKIIQDEDGFITHIVYARDHVRRVGIAKKELIK